MEVEAEKKNDSSEVYRGRYTLEGKSGNVLVVDDKRIIDEIAADRRARAEFIKNGMDAQKIKFRSYVAHVSVGDVIRVSAPSFRVPKDLSKDRFIVTKVQTVIDDKTSEIIVEAVRYD